MQPIPQSMQAFILANNVLNLTACSAQQMWAASCFYAFDAAHARLIVLTSTNTQHAQLMRQNPQIVGTISTQPQSIREIQGIQFAATATLLETEVAQQALQLYRQRHPIAKLFHSDVWELRLTLLKFTDNTLGFAHKSHWQRNA